MADQKGAQQHQRQAKPPQNVSPVQKHQKPAQLPQNKPAPLVPLNTLQHTQNQQAPLSQHHSSSGQQSSPSYQKSHMQAQQPQQNRQQQPQQNRQQQPQQNRPAPQPAQNSQKVQQQHTQQHRIPQTAYQHRSGQTQHHPRVREGDNTILVGKKPAMSYVMAVMTQLNNQQKEIHVRARGLSINKAVDVVEILRNKFVKGLRYGVSFETESLQNRDNRQVNVSVIDIKVER